jgi:signal transduction histidine kinase
MREGDVVTTLGLLARPGVRIQWAVIAVCATLSIEGALTPLALGYPRDTAFIAVVAYSLSYLVAGAAGWIRRPGNPTGLVMLVSAVAGGVSFLILSADPAAQQVGWIAGGVTNVLLVWLVLASPGGRLSSRLDRALFVGVLAFTIVVVGFLDVVARQQLLAWVPVPVALALGLLAFRRWLLATPAARRALTPVTISGVAAAIVFFVSGTTYLLGSPVGLERMLHWAEGLARALIPFGFLLGLLRLRMARGAVADLVVELGDMPPPERLRAALAGALRDPTLEVLYWSAPFRTYLDRDGAPVEVPAERDDRAVTLLERAGSPLAAILHDPAVADDPELVAAVGATVRLAVENERLNAEVHAQLAEVQASRSRIVEMADAERRRVERNLHDGAQQRLVGLSLALRRAQAKLPTDAEPELTATLEDASAQLKTALAELRELARGIHPAILTEAGLGSAMRSLARDSDVPVTLRLNLPHGLPASIEAGAYFVAAEALVNIAKYAAASHVELTAEAENGQLRIEIADDGCGGADPNRGSGLRGLADRVAALGGRLDIRSPVGDGTRVVARLPIAADTEVQR